jgi:hypothetical protein
MAPLTRSLSRLIGLSFVLFALAVITHKLATVEALGALFHSPALVLVLGIVFLVIGLALVLNHNIWSGGALTVIVTLIGWVSLIRGLLLLFLSPNAIVELFGMLHFDQLFYFYVAISLAIGAYLTYGGFSQRGPLEAGRDSSNR